MPSSSVMRAARFYEPGVLKLENVPLPTLGAGEILVKPHVVLTCGTDVKMYRRGHPFAKPPLIIGHEFAGEAVEVGSGVEHFGPGMRVVAANSAPCNACYFCKLGKPNLCENLDDAIIGFTRQGAYADYVVIPERIARVNTYEIPESIPFEQAAFLEPLACVVHGNELAQVQRGDVVVVIGGGPIGLMHLLLAKLGGAGRVTVCDISDQRLREAADLGADEVVNTSKVEFSRAIRDRTDGRGGDVVIEAVGRPETWSEAVMATRKGGTTMLFGGCPSGTSVPFDAGHIHYGEITVKGSFHHTPASVKRALELIASRKVKVAPLITARMGLSQVERALKDMGEGRALKIALDPSS
jgi:L-iditol 2-dehydrogenase